MAPVNKSKKGKHQIKDSDNPKTMESSKSKAKDSGKFKGAKPGCAVAAHQPDLRDPDMEWWYAFLSKQKERQADSDYMGDHLQIEQGIWHHKGWSKGVRL